MTKASLPWRIERTDAFSDLQAMFHQNGLEVDLTVTEPVGVLGLWQAVLPDTGRRIGAVKLEMRQGEYVIGCLAVDESYRRQQIGAQLLGEALSLARAQQAPRVLLVAKVPAFFKKAGFYQVDMEDYRQITKCYTCSQRGESCFPEVLRLDLDVM